jgi:hypothetical protein
MARSLLPALLLAFLLPPASARQQRGPERVEFNRDIRPILSDACIKCHGPDPKHREAGLRLDTPEGAFAEYEPGRRALVPGNLEKSHLWRRVATRDRDDLMPPPKSGKKLTPAQKDLIRRWIEQGAEFQGHWAFVPPLRRDAPPLRNGAVNAIDAWIDARLAREGLRRSPEADRRTLARRVALDLTGLPPTLEEAVAFEKDDAPDAYERYVDRLLASPRYGEHMARYWLDLARYGDTHGLHLDNYREMWPYRDWVVRAFRENLPFDRFVVEQVAGDLLPDASLDQKIASGFNRCHVTTNEGGSIAEEVYVRNVFDRVETFSQVFFALTFTCARCHDHKYDPFTQKDYYALFAFFNSLDGSEMDGNRKDSPPVVKVPDAAQASELAALRKAIEETLAAQTAPMPELDVLQPEWERAYAARLADPWRPVEIRERGPLELSATLEAGQARAFRVELRPLEEGKGPLRFELGSVEATLGGRKLAWRAALAEAPGHALLPLLDGKPDTAWSGDARTHPAVVLIPASAPAAGELVLKFVSKGTAPPLSLRLSATTNEDLLAGTTPAVWGPWHLLGAFKAADGAEAFRTVYGPEQGVDLAAGAGGLKWIRKDDGEDGKDLKYPEGIGASFAYRTVHAPSPRSLTLTVNSDDAIQVWLNGALVLSRNVKRTYRAYDANKIPVELQAGENAVLLKFSNSGTTKAHTFSFRPSDESLNDLLGEVREALAAEPAARSPSQKALLRSRFRREQGAAYRDLLRRAAELKGRETELLDRVFKEAAKPKDAFLLERGEYDRKRDKVGRATPGALPPLPEGAPLDRLGLARWLLDPAHPLTARVAVNRFWQQVFGVGLVKTSEDFGLTGEPPEHPELLDELALGFVKDGWDVKRFMRRLLLSATYRQSSKTPPELAARDPENRLLARGPRFRLDAETVRDQILFLGGLLREAPGGAGVKPPQPEGLWEAVGYTGSNTYRFTRDVGPEKVFRRSLYIFWKRTSAPPMMTLFDAPSRESCVARRERTNTPLQALMLMNEPQCVEAARHLAARAIREGGADPAARAAWMLRRCTQREPSEADVRDLAALAASQQEAYARDPEAAKLAVAGGDLPVEAGADPAELAAWTLAAGAVLNLDEVLNKR